VEWFLTPVSDQKTQGFIMKNKGTIGVTTHDIFPIIKKFLYSDHEIFLRELISNAVDATQKIKALAAKGDFKGELGDLTIRVSSDPEKKTITVSDKGIGMTEEEVDKYINQIAFSSAGEFLEKYKDQANNIIGHFGLGFYSSFMVAKKVEIITKSWQEEAQAVKWTCKGTPEYTLEPTEKTDRGTDIVLHLYAENESYAQESQVETLLHKYCSFLPVEIAFGKEKEWKDGKEVVLDKDKIVNDVNPLWTRKPADLKEEEYKAFYSKLYPMAEDPLFWIHLNVDYPFKLTGVLYFPKIKDKLEVTRNKIQLYCNQVFVTDNVEHIVPDFLTLLHGVIDSPDIPLNVSRSYLQSDSNVKKISNHITRKVADRLEEIFKTDRASFEEKWDNLKLFIEYGMLTEDKFYDRAFKFVLLKNTDGKYLSFDEYQTLIEPNQKDKDNKLVYLYATNTQEQYAYISAAKEKGYGVLLLDSPLCAHFVNLLESKMKDVRFVRVDSDTPEKLISKEELAKPDMSEEEEKELREAFQEVLPKDVTFTVNFENMGSQQNPVMITQGEWMRRYREMSALGGGMNFMGSMPDSYSLVVNFEHPLVQKIRESKDKKLISQVCDLALLANNLLKGESLNTFIKRSVDLL
jgi:molecular chaperone HtpG